MCYFSGVLEEDKELHEKTEQNTSSFQIKTIWVMIICQQNENRSCTDDDVCRDNLAGRNGEVRHVCQCLNWEKCTVWPAASSHAKPQHIRCTAYLQLIILLTADPSRGLEVNLASILVKVVPFMCKVTNSSPF